MPPAFSAWAYPKQSADALRNREVNMLEQLHSVSDTGTSYASVIEEMQSMRDYSQMLPARCHDGPRAGSPASVKYGCKVPLEILHKLRECIALESLTRNVHCN